ncbi:hypothetical protein EDC01DRAFT_679410 [Geopyxis carbonaria]|nr:hypothetical protein EDC01DRAFT_679410 [Geopyxis carbonaria]
MQYALPLLLLSLQWAIPLAAGHPVDDKTPPKTPPRPPRNRNPPVREGMTQIPDDAAGGPATPEKKPKDSGLPHQITICGEHADLENHYPSHNTAFLKNNKWDGIPYFDYASEEWSDWNIQEFKRAEVQTRSRLLSDYVEFPVDDKLKITPAMEKIKKDMPPCMQIEKKDRGIIGTGKTQLEDFNLEAGWFHTEHTFEKQIIGKFFNLLDEEKKVTRASCKWMKGVIFGPDANLQCYHDNTPSYKAAFPFLVKRTWETNKWSDKTPLDKTPLKPGSIDKIATTLTAMGVSIGNKHRPDLLTVLESNINLAKGKLFTGVSPHSKDSFKKIGELGCIDNPKYIKDPMDPQPAKTVLNDRLTYIKHAGLVISYLKNDKVWETFANAASNVHQVAKRFDELYATLHPENSDKFTDMKQFHAASPAMCKNPSPLWQDTTGPDPNTFKLETLFEEKLIVIMKELFKTTETYLVESAKWMTEDFYPSTGKDDDPDSEFTPEMRTKLGKLVADHTADKLLAFFQPKILEIFKSPTSIVDLTAGLGNVKIGSS